MDKRLFDGKTSKNLLRGGPRIDSRGACRVIIPPLVCPLSLDLRIATTKAGQSAPSSVSAVLAFVLSLPLLLSFKSIMLLPLFTYQSDTLVLLVERWISLHD